MIRIAINEKKWVRRVFWTCAGIILTIVLMDIFFNYYRWIPFRLLRRSFNITREAAIGNWFSSLLALTTALILLLTHLSTSPRKRGWAVLSAFFGYMAIDDATRFHEGVGSAFVEWMGHENMKSLAFKGYAWQMIFLPVFGPLGLYILYFLWAELRKTVWMRLIVCALGLFVIAVCLDILEGLKLDLWRSYTIRHFQKLIEESMEMFALTLFLVAFFGRLIEGKETIEIT